MVWGNSTNNHEKRTRISRREKHIVKKILLYLLIVQSVQAGLSITKIAILPPCEYPEWNRVQIEASVLPNRLYLISYTHDFEFWWILDFVETKNTIRLVRTYCTEEFVFFPDEPTFFTIEEI